MPDCALEIVHLRQSSFVGDIRSIVLVVGASCGNLLVDKDHLITQLKGQSAVTVL